MVPWKDIKAKIDRAVTYHHENGFKNFFWHLLSELGFVNYNRDLVFNCVDLDAMLFKTQESFSFHIETVQELQTEQVYRDLWFTKEEAAKRLKNGCRLFVLKIKSEIIFFTWIEEREATIDWIGIKMKLPDNVAYLTGVCTVPEYRRRGISSKIKREILQYLKKEGMSKVVEVVDPLNSVALKMDNRLGFKEYQRVNYRRCWLLQRYRIKQFGSDQQKTFFSIWPFRNPAVWNCFLGP